MAKVMFGPIVSEARGKVGDVVFSRYSSGAVSHAVPRQVNPRTPAQYAARDAMKQIGKAWGNDLTDRQRLAWQALASATIHTDRFRQAFAPSGQGLFSELNLNALNAGGSQIDTPPLRISAPDPGPLSASADGNAFSLSLTPTVPCPTGHGIICMATCPIRPGRNWWANRLRQLRNLDSSPLPPSALPALGPSYVDRFGPLPAGMRVGLTLAYVNLATGAKSPAQSTLATIQGDKPMLLTVRKHLTAAQILGLLTTPVEIIPAPGPGLCLYPLASWFHYIFKSIPYTVDPSSYLVYRPHLYDDDANIGPYLLGLLDQTQDAWSIDLGYNTSTTLLTSPDNQALDLTLDGVAPLAGDGELDISLTYLVVPTP